MNFGVCLKLLTYSWPLFFCMSHMYTLRGWCVLYVLLQASSFFARKILRPRSDLEKTEDSHLLL